jgi:hypothetical protein
MAILDKASKTTIAHFLFASRNRNIIDNKTYMELKVFLHELSAEPWRRSSRSFLRWPLRLSTSPLSACGPQVWSGVTFVGGALAIVLAILIERYHQRLGIQLGRLTDAMADWG